MTTRRVARVGAMAVVSVLGAACGDSEADIATGDDPLRALAVGRLSDRYGSTYWTRKAAEDPVLWAKAEAYCEGRTDGDHPNCDAVRQVRIIENMSRVPEDRPSEFGLTVPQGAQPDDTLR